MKRSIPAFVVLALLMSLTVSAQEIQGYANSSVTAKLVTKTGKVSDDGKSLVSDKEDSWMAVNGALKGHEGQLVTVRCVPTGEHSMQVLSVKVRREAPKYSANWGDSAFRR